MTVAAAAGVPWAIMPGGLSIRVRLTPKGGRDAVEGIERLADGSAVLKVRVRAAPAEGEANAALIRIVAKSLDVAPRQLTLVAGAAARIKRLMVAGDGARLAAALEKMTAAG